MKKKLINKKSITPACGLCAHGRISPDGESVLCIRTGVRQMESSCRSFKYDPLKRKPKKAAKPEEFTATDFEL